MEPRPDLNAIANKLQARSIFACGFFYRVVPERWRLGDKENLMNIELVLEDVVYKDWAIVTGEDYLQVVFIVNGQIQRGRKWRISEYMSKSELVQTALAAVLAAEEHEARERFLYKGYAVYGPHFDVDALVGLAKEEKLDRRAGAA
jgi:hypothetical protein